MEALDYANLVREQAATALRELKSGGIDLEHALLDYRLRHLPVYRVLEKQPRWGKYRAATVLNRTQISPLWKVSNLTDSMIQRLVQEPKP